MRTNRNVVGKVVCLALIVTILLATCAVPQAKAARSAQTRVIRLRVLNDSSTWGPTGYTAQQILGMIADLEPTMLQRYISGPQNPSASVPVCSICAPMTVAQFLQASENVDGATIVARLSLNDYDLGTLFSEAQALRNFQITPRLSWISLDDFAGWIQNHTSAQLVFIVDTLESQGWDHVESGGCGSHASVPDGLTNFASVCYASPSFEISQNSVSGWASYKSIQFVLGAPDFPNDIPILNALGGSAAEAAVFSNLAANQSQIGYSLIYPILQGAWDSNKITVKGGPYEGQTLYQEMKSLMNRFNPFLSGTSTSTSVGSSTSAKTTPTTAGFTSTTLETTSTTLETTSTTSETTYLTSGESTTSGVSTDSGASVTTEIASPYTALAYPLVATMVGVILGCVVVSILFRKVPRGNRLGQ